jgi:DNA/RNA endonuclease YhcR with UshA esterase domain
MKGKIPAIFASVLIALGAGATAWAHHSFAAEYDMKHPITVHGTVVQVRLENPHSWFVVDVKDAAGKVDRWSFEAGTPSGMIRNGYRQGMIKPGDEVTIKGFQSKDSDVRGMLRELDTADGHVYGLFGPQQSRPDDK